MRRRSTAIWVLCLVLASCSSEETLDDAPATLESDRARTASFDGLPVAYTAAGEGSGAVVLIHGWGGDRSVWSAQVENLAPDYRVVAIDLGGHGESGRAREAWTVAALARDVEAVLDELELASFVLVGHSMGGAVALEVARRMPHRTIGIVGVDTFLDFERRPPEPAWSDLLAALDRDFDAACSRMVGSMFLADADPDLVERVVRDTCDADPDVARALLRDLGAFDAAAAARAAGVPVRSIHSAANPTNVEANRRHAEDFDVVAMDGVGHFPMLERPAELNAHLRRMIEELTAGGV